MKSSIFGLTALVAGLFSAQAAYAADTDQDQVDTAKVDCRTEGTAVGLTGADLDQFVAECVQDLLDIEYVNKR